MRRDGGWWVALDPTIGGEIRKTRPAITIFNDRWNASGNRVQIVPVTSQTRRVHASEALVNVDGNLAKAVADQLRTIDKSRLRGHVGRLTDVEMKAVEQAVRFQLDL